MEVVLGYFEFVVSYKDIFYISNFNCRLVGFWMRFEME